MQPRAHLWRVSTVGHSFVRTRDGSHPWPARSVDASEKLDVEVVLVFDALHQAPAPVARNLSCEWQGGRQRARGVRGVKHACTKDRSFVAGVISFRTAVEKHSSYFYNSDYLHYSTTATAAAAVFYQYHCSCYYYTRYFLVSTINMPGPLSHSAPHTATSPISPVAYLHKKKYFRLKTIGGSTP